MTRLCKIGAEKCMTPEYGRMIRCPYSLIRVRRTTAVYGGSPMILPGNARTNITCISSAPSATCRTSSRAHCMSWSLPHDAPIETTDFDDHRRGRRGVVLHHPTGAVALRRRQSRDAGGHGPEPAA